MNINIHYINDSFLMNEQKNIEGPMNKWNTITNLIKNKDIYTNVICN